jgi:hypothetical protein
MLITLKAKTLKGKNRIHEIHESVIKRKPNWQDVWMVGKSHDNVAFSQLEGPWLFIFPQGSDSREVDKFSRWVNLKADVDFEVVVKEP